ncbi:type 1 glutamine amidotransferase [Listeria costaricensis]|uniref:type 1 glutamine amidotransferase n=1 Tax=Listeria costaricensis TaxID=2026604 RepID=UPI000C08459B|nr:type 1 glutamine amidotransferase [Listeria costaricensis]
MKIDCLQHVAFENPGLIEDWCKERGYALQVHRLDLGEAVPVAEAVDFLVVLGGPMNIYDDWEPLAKERSLIEALHQAKKPVFGVCLGAQQIAAALGGEVVPNPVKEVGFFPIQTTAAKTITDAFPEELTVFHWHGDTFTLPVGAQQIFASVGCANQGFFVEPNLVGLQFHFETKRENVAAIVQHDAAYITEGPYIQSREEIEQTEIPAENKRVLFALLDRLVQGA